MKSTILIVEDEEKMRHLFKAQLEGQGDDIYTAGDYGAALEARDASLCETMEKKEGRDKCFNNVAVKTNDTAVCDNIKDEADKNECIRSTEFTTLQK